MLQTTKRDFRNHETFKERTNFYVCAMDNIQQIADAMQNGI